MTSDDWFIVGKAAGFASGVLLWSLLTGGRVSKWLSQPRGGILAGPERFGAAIERKVRARIECRRTERGD